MGHLAGAMGGKGGCKEGGRGVKCVSVKVILSGKCILFESSVDMKQC